MKRTEIPAELLAKLSGVHASDCAVHNEPAQPKGACDCGVLTAIKYPCTCCLPPDYEGCYCDNSGDLSSQWYAIGWNAAIEQLQSALEKAGVKL